MIRVRFAAVFVVAAVVSLPHPAAAQDLSRYRDIPFGSGVAAVAAITDIRNDVVKVIHERPGLIQEVTWRPQYALSLPAGRIETAQDITFRFHNDNLYRVTVRYDARLVEGLTNQDIIQAVSAVYGPAVLTPAAALKGAPQPPAGSINASTAIARWQSTDHEFTLMREVYPATYRLIGVSRRLESLATATEREAARLDKLEAPRREAERVEADAERKRAAEEKARTTNKAEFRP